MWLASSHLVQGRDAVRSQQQNATPFAFMKRGESIYGLRNSWLSRKTLLRLVGFKPFCIVSFHFVIDELTLVPRCLVNQSMRAKTFCLKQDVKLRCYVNPLNTASYLMLLTAKIDKFLTLTTFNVCIQIFVLLQSSRVIITKNKTTYQRIKLLRNTLALKLDLFQNWTNLVLWNQKLGRSDIE